MGDKFTVEILEDGTIKASTDVISAASHTSAENFLAEMARMAGGKVTKTHKKGVRHEHNHSTHIHQGHSH